MVAKIMVLSGIKRDHLVAIFRHALQTVQHSNCSKLCCLRA